MKTKNLLIAMALVLVLTPFLLQLASSEDVAASGSDSAFLGTFKQGDCIQLIQTCGNCSFVNISSVQFPNSSIALGQVAMQKSGTFYNYTYCAKVSGSYRVNGYGNPDSPTLYETFTYTFDVTPTGDTSSNTFFIILGIAAIVFLLLAYVFKNTIFAFLSGIAFLIAGVYTMINGFSNVTTTYTYAIAVVIIGLGLILTVTSALDFMDETYGNDDSGGGVEEE